MSQVAVIEADAVVATMTRARAALAEAKTIQETKRIVDAAAAAEIYAKRQKLGEETSDLAQSIKIDALRRLGEMLQATPRAKGAKTLGGGTGAGGSISIPPAQAPTLEELGLTKKESAVAQKLASLPEEDFQNVRQGHTTVAKAIAAIDATKATQKKPKRTIESRPAEIPPEDHADELNEARFTITELSEENDSLRDRVAIAAMDATDEEKYAAQTTIKELRERVKALEAELDAVKSTRDQYMLESAEKTKQVNYWRRKAEKVAA